MATSENTAVGTALGSVLGKMLDKTPNRALVWVPGRTLAKPRAEIVMFLNIATTFTLEPLEGDHELSKNRPMLFFFNRPKRLG